MSLFRISVLALVSFIISCSQESSSFSGGVRSVSKGEISDDLIADTPVGELGEKEQLKEQAENETDKPVIITKKEQEIIDWKAIFDASFNGSLNNGSWVLTPPSKNKKGLIISKERYPIDSIEISFMLKITDNGGSSDSDGVGADGISFAMTPNSESEMNPGIGGAIGFEGIGGFAVEIDTYKNGGEVNGNHVAIMKDENNKMSELKVVKVDSYRFNDGRARKVTIRVDKGVVSISIDGQSIINSYTIPNFQAFDGHMAISSATGNGWGRHQVWDVFAKLL